jgi:hypothetical protein
MIIIATMDNNESNYNSSNNNSVHIPYILHIAYIYNMWYVIYLSVPGVAPRHCADPAAAAAEDLHLRADPGGQNKNFSGTRWKSLDYPLVMSK